MASDKDIKLDEGFEEVTDVSLDAGFEEVEVPTVKKKDVPAPKLESGSEATISSNGQSKSTSASTIVNKTTDFSFPDFSKQNIQGVTGTPVAIQKQSKPILKDVLGKGTTVKQQTSVTPQVNDIYAPPVYRPESENTDTGLVNVSQQAESKRIAQEAEKVKREQELANPNSFQNIGTSYKEKALKTTGNNDIEKMLNFGDINGNKAFVEATLDDNDKHILGVTKEIEKINNDNKIYEQQLKSGAITQEIYDAHKKENTKKSIDLNAEYVKGIQSRNSAIDDEIKQSQTKLANGYDIKMLGAQPYSEPLTTQQIDEEKKKIKTLTDLKNDVLIDVNNPVKSLEKHEGFQNAEKEGLIPNGATNIQKVRIYSYILADKAKKLATELGYNPNDVKSLMGDKFGSNTPKMWWEQLKSLVVGSNPKEKEYVHTMAELQAIAPIAILNKNNLTLNEGYTSNLVSSFRKSVAPLFVRNQIATDEDRNALTKEAFNQAGVNDGVSQAYTDQQASTEKESKTLGKTVARTTGDVLGIGVKIGLINPILDIPAAAIEGAVGKPILSGLDKALSTSKEAQALEAEGLLKAGETATKASDIASIDKAKKVLDIAKVVAEKIPNNFLTRTVYNTVKTGVVHEIQGRVNDELKGFANFEVGAVNHLIGMPLNTLGQVAIRLFGKDAPAFVSQVVHAVQAGTSMTATMAGMTAVNDAKESESFDAFKEKLDEQFGTTDKKLRFIAENFLLGLTMHAANISTLSGLFNANYTKLYEALKPEEKAKVDEFVKSVNEDANDFESETKDAVAEVKNDTHENKTTDEEAKLASAVNIRSQDFGDIESIKENKVADNKEIDDAIANIDKTLPEWQQDVQVKKLEEQRKQQNDFYDSQIKQIENEQTNQNTTEQQDNGNSSGVAGSKQDAKIESAVIEIGGKIYEGKNHAEAILKAKADGQDISQVDRQAEGLFKLSDGTIINREQAKEQFGQDRSELIIPQDEAAKQANKDYAEITKGLKNEQTNQNTPEQQDNGNSTGMAGSEQNSEAVRTKSEQGKLSNQKEVQQNNETEKQIAEVKQVIQELEANPNSPFAKLVNLDEQKQKLSELEAKQQGNLLNEQKGENKQDNKGLIEQTTPQPESNTALRDVDSTAKALEEVAKTKPTLWEKIKEAVKNVGKKLGIISNADHINNFNTAKAEWDKLSSREKKLKRADYELDDLHHTEGGYYKVGNSLIDLDLNSNHLKLLLENNKFLNVLNKLGVTKIHGENRPAEEMFAHYSDGKIHLNNNSAFENIRQVTNAMSHELGHHEWTKLTKEERDYVRSLPLETGMAKHYEAQEKSGKGKETSASLQEENFADYVMQYFQGKLYGDEALLNKIPIKLREMFDNKYSDLLKDNEHSDIAEAYHKAKADGSNPELVKAVEEALKPTPEVSKPVSEVVEKGEGKSADVMPTNAWGSKESIDNNFYTKNENGFAVKIPLDRVENVNIDGIDFHVSKVDGDWKVIEKNSGLEVSTGKLSNTKKSAIEDATYRISNNGGANNISTISERAIKQFTDSNLKLIEAPISKTETTENPALKDVESTSKALEGKDITTFISSTDINALNKQLYNNLYAKQKELLAKGVMDFQNNSEIKAIKAQIDFSEALLKNDTKAISEAYHKAKADGSNPELVKAVESLLSKEQPTSTTQSEIEAKKADIEIGKVGNTDYEVKVDGVYYQGKKLNNPENKTHRQLIEADIERRRQEELKDELDKKAKDIPVKKEYYKDTNGNDITVTTYRAGNKTFTFTKSNNVAADNFEDLDLESITPYKTENITSKLENKINAKYDAELKALEQSLPTQEPKAEQPTVLGKEVGSGVGGDVDLGNNTIIVNMSLPLDSGVNTGLVKNSKGAVYHDKNTSKLEKLGYSKEQIDKLSQAELDEILAKNIENPNVETSAKMPLAETQTTTQEFLNEANKEGGRFAELAKALKQFFGIDGVETEIVKGLKDFFGKNNDGDYANNKIRIDENAKNKLQTFLHEAIHKVTVDKLLQFERGDYSKLSKQDIEAIQNLTRIFNESKAKIHEFLGGGKGDRTKGHYGFTNVHEFISEAFTNPEFQSLLKNLPTEGNNPTIFKQFLDAVAKFLGLKDVSILNDIFYYTENLNNKAVEQSGEVGSGVVDGIKDKTLLSELANEYSSYEEMKADLDKDEIDYNEQDLKDAWGIKENSEEENIGIKRRITDKRREELGLNAVTLPKIADNNSAMKVAKELVDSGDVNPMEIENELISNVENPAKAKASKEDVHIIQYRRLQLENKEKALLSNKIRLDEAIKSNPDDADAVAEYLINEENIKNNNADLDRNTTASRVISNIFAGIGHGLQTEMNAAGEVQALIKKVRDSFGDNIPEDVKKRLDSLEQENKELKIKNEEIENKYNNVIPKEEADKHIIEAYEKGKKDGSAGSQPKKYTQKFNRIADAFERKFKSKPLILRDADGNEIKLTQNSIVAWDDIVKIGAEAIRKTGEVIDGVNAIIEHIKDQDWYKNLSPNSKDAVKQQYEDYFTGKENKKKEDGLKVTSSRIKEIIERRKSENENTTVDDVVEEINRDFPDATPRQIRDAISGYGTIKEGSQEPIDKEVRKIKRMAKYDSILEDISNGVRPDKTGFQRDTLEVDELDQLKKIREGLKKLPLSDADLSKKLKTAQDAIETRLRNQIESLEKQIQTGEKSIRNTKVQTTPEIERLKVIRDEKKAILDEAESLNRHGDTLQELKDIADETGDTTITKKTVDDGLIKDLIQAHIEKGTPVEEIQKEIFDELKAIFPDTTERQVSDAITKQGQYKSEGNTLTELQQQLAELKKQANLKTKIEDIEKGIIAQTKVKDEKSKEVERLQQQLAELKKQANLKTKIEDIEKGIIAQTKVKGEKSKEVQDLQKQLADLKSQARLQSAIEDVQAGIVRETKAKGEKSKEVERLQQQLAELKKQANLKTKIEDTEKGIIAQTKVKGEKSKEVERLQQQLAELKKQALNKYADVSAADLVKKYEAVERQIKKGDYIKQKTTRTKFESDINWAKNNKRLTDIKIELNKLKDKALENNKNTFMKTLDIFDKWSTRMLFFGTYAYQLKLAATAASSIIHKPIEDIVGGLIYNSTLKNIAKNAPIEGNTKSSAVNLKDYYAELLRVDKWVKGILQLASKGETSLDQQNNKYGHINFSLKFKGKTAGEIVRQTIGADHIPLIDLLTTDPHAMIKEPIKRATYKAAFNTYMDWVETNMGAEAVNDPLIIEVGKNVAFLKAKSEIFMGNAQTESGGIENQGFIDSLNGKISQLRNEAIKNAQSTYSNEESKANADYAKASLAKFFVPIVKVPTNIIARAIKGNPVVLLRNIFKAIQINNDIEKGSAITNEHADAIIRDLKKGTVTSMYWFAGALLANSIVGGFWNPFYPDKKRKGKMPKINEMNLGQKKHGITDLMIHGAEHAPNVQAMMLGATFMQTLGYYNKNKKENLAYSFAVATAATANATADQHPIYSTVSDLLQATQNEHGLDKFGNNIKRRFDIKKKFEDLNPADYYKGKMHPADSGSGSDSGSSRGSDSRTTTR